MSIRTRPTASRPRTRAVTRTAPSGDGALDERSRIWQAVHAIPPGRVSTYGEIARVAGLPGRARLVGQVLSQLPEDTRLPWHRVLNASGRISVRGGGEVLQAERLRGEGVLFVLAAQSGNKSGNRIDLTRYGWPDGTDAQPCPATRAQRRREAPAP